MAWARIQAERNSGDRKESAIMKARGKRHLQWLAAAALLFGNGGLAQAQQGDAPAGALRVPRVSSKEAMERPIALSDEAGRVISKDGKTLTITGKNAQGQEVNNVQVSEKQ